MVLTLGFRDVSHISGMIFRKHLGAVLHKLSCWGQFNHQQLISPSQMVDSVDSHCGALPTRNDWPLGTDFVEQRLTTEQQLAEAREGDLRWGSDWLQIFGDEHENTAEATFEALALCGQQWWAYRHIVLLAAAWSQTQIDDHFFHGVPATLINNC